MNKAGPEIAWIQRHMTVCKSLAQCEYWHGDQFVSRYLGVINSLIELSELANRYPFGPQWSLLMDFGALGRHAGFSPKEINWLQKTELFVRKILVDSGTRHAFYGPGELMAMSATGSTVAESPGDWAIADRVFRSHEWCDRGDYDEPAAALDAGWTKVVRLYQRNEEFDQDLDRNFPPDQGPHSERYKPQMSDHDYGVIMDFLNPVQWLTSIMMDPRTDHITRATRRIFFQGLILRQLGESHDGPAFGAAFDPLFSVLTGQRHHYDGNLNYVEYVAQQISSHFRLGDLERMDNINHNWVDHVAEWLYMARCTLEEALGIREERGHWLVAALVAVKGPATRHCWTAKYTVDVGGIDDPVHSSLRSRMREKRWRIFVERAFNCLVTWGISASGRYVIATVPQRLRDAPYDDLYGECRIPIRPDEDAIVLAWASFVAWNYLVEVRRGYWDAKTGTYKKPGWNLVFHSVSMGWRKFWHDWLCDRRNDRTGRLDTGALEVVKTMEVVKTLDFRRWCPDNFHAQLVMTNEFTDKVWYSMKWIHRWRYETQALAPEGDSSEGEGATSGEEYM